MPTAPLTSTSATDPQWVELGVFTQPHGVSGRIKVKSFTDPADDFATHPELTDTNGRLYKLRITGHAQGMPIVEIEGITKREQAELLRGRKIGVARQQMPELKAENSYYTDDLSGMEVVDTTGTAFGKVTRVVNYGASDILEITHTDGSEGLYAFTHATFPSIDLATKRIIIDPPEILDTQEETSGK